MIRYSHTPIAMFSTILPYLLAAYAVSLVGFGLSLLKAPAGYQDVQGFHYGLAPKRLMFARRRPAHRSRN